MSRTDLVDVAALRAAVLASDTSHNAAARELGYMKPDGQRVKRALGITATVKHERKWYAKSVDYAIAVQIARAYDIDPVDVGL